MKGQIYSEAMGLGFLHKSFKIPPQKKKKKKEATTRKKKKKKKEKRKTKPLIREYKFQ